MPARGRKKSGSFTEFDKFLKRQLINQFGEPIFDDCGFPVYTEILDPQCPVLLPVIKKRIADDITEADQTWSSDKIDTTIEHRSFDSFTVTSPSNKVYSLGFLAANDLAEVQLNGVSELQDTNYIVSGSTVTIDNGVTLTTGDKIDIWYNYTK